MFGKTSGKEVATFVLGLSCLLLETRTCETAALGETAVERVGRARRPRAVVRREEVLVESGREGVAGGRVRRGATDGPVRRRARRERRVLDLPFRKCPSAQSCSGQTQTQLTAIFTFSFS